MKTTSKKKKNDIVDLRVLEAQSISASVPLRWTFLAVAFAAEASSICVQRS